MRTTLIVTAALLALAGPLAHASPDADRRAAAKEKWDKMTPEQKAAAKEKMKERWDNMTPEQQAAAKKRMAERHPRAAERRAEGAASAAK
ncbi:MAG: DUF3106 domain-containing protein [Rubrivivax sp.]|jgi:hypothetical protein